MPSRHSTPTKSSRRAEPRLTLVRSPKGRKPALAAKKSARGSKAVAVKVRLVPAPKAKAPVKKAGAKKPAFKPPVRKPAPLALVPAKGKVAAAVTSVPVERVPREQLLSRYTPLIKYVVERLAVGLPKNVDHEDLMSAGMLGLLDAYDKFDSKKGTKFETYAVWR